MGVGILEGTGPEYFLNGIANPSVLALKSLKVFLQKYSFAISLVPPAGSTILGGCFPFAFISQLTIKKALQGDLELASRLP